MPSVPTVAAKSKSSTGATFVPDNPPGTRMRVNFFLCFRPGDEHRRLAIYLQDRHLLALTHMVHRAVGFDNCPWRWENLSVLVECLLDIDNMDDFERQVRLDRDSARILCEMIDAARAGPGLDSTLEIPVNDSEIYQLRDDLGALMDFEGKMRALEKATDLQPPWGWSREF